MDLKIKTLIAAAALAVAAPAAQASTITLSTIDDGRAKTAGGETAETGDEVIQFSNDANWAGIFEFNLSSLSDDVTITGARFEYTITEPAAGKFGAQGTAGYGSPADLYTFLGDGSVTANDRTTKGTHVYDDVAVWGGASGDVVSFVLTDLSDIKAALANNLLTVRYEGGIFSHIYVAALENTTYDAARLIIDYVTPVSQVPLPATLPLAAAAMLGLYGVSRRRRRA